MTTRAERVETAAALHDQGLTQTEICRVMGLARSTVSAYLCDPHLDAQRQRREGYGSLHPCLSCGGPTDGSKGLKRSADYCEQCVRNGAHKVWTREALLDAVRRWADEHGRPPTATDWVRADREHSYPAATSCYRSAHPERGGTYLDHVPFEQWADMIEAAGFRRPFRGHKFNTGREARGLMPSAGSRGFIVLERNGNGWIEHGPVQATTATGAVEQVASEMEKVDGEFVAFSERQWIPMRLEPVSTIRAVRVEP